MRAGVTREENRELHLKKLNELTAEYERRVYSDDPFSDEEMRSMRTRIRKVRAAFERLRFPSYTTED